MRTVSHEGFVYAVASIMVFVKILSPHQDSDALLVTEVIKPGNWHVLPGVCWHSCALDPLTGASWRPVAPRLPLDFHPMASHAPLPALSRAGSPFSHFGGDSSPSRGVSSKACADQSSGTHWLYGPMSPACFPDSGLAWSPPCSAAWRYPPPSAGQRRTPALWGPARAV